MTFNEMVANINLNLISLFRNQGKRNVEFEMKIKEQDKRIAVLEKEVAHLKKDLYEGLAYNLYEATERIKEEIGGE